MVPREIRSGRISEKHIANMIEDFLTGRSANIEHITFKNGITGIKEIYVIPEDIRSGRTVIHPNVMKAHLVTPDGRYFGSVAVKHYRTSVREEDAATMLPPTIAQSDSKEQGRKLAIQMWMAKPSAFEYIMEVAKVVNAWKHLVPKRRSDVVVSDLTPQNVRKWIVDLDVYQNMRAKEWDKLALYEFRKEYGRRAIAALSKAADILGLSKDLKRTFLEKVQRGKIDDDVMVVMKHILDELPKRKEFWEHHVQKDLKLLQAVDKRARIPHKRRMLLKALAKSITEKGPTAPRETLLNLLELERNIVAEWIAGYKRALQKAIKGGKA